MSAPVLLRVQIPCFQCRETGKALPDGREDWDPSEIDPPCPWCGGSGRPFVLTDMSGKLHFPGVVPATESEMRNKAERFL